MGISLFKRKRDRTEETVFVPSPIDLSTWAWKILTFLTVAAVVFVFASLKDIQSLVTTGMGDADVKSTSFVNANNKTEDRMELWKTSHLTSASINDITLPPTASSITLTLQPTASKELVKNVPAPNPQVDAHNDNSPECEPNATCNNTLEIPPSRRYHVFQFSGTELASTFTVNLLTGLFEGVEQGVTYWECKDRNQWKKESCTWWQRLNQIKGLNSSHLMNTTIVTMTDVQDADLLQSWFQNDFDKIFFVGIERMENDKFLPSKYCANNTYPNILCLEYNDLQYIGEEGLRKVVKYVKDRIHSSFPYFAHVQLKEEEAVQRLLDMAQSFQGDPRYNSDRYGLGENHSNSPTLEPSSVTKEPASVTKEPALAPTDQSTTTGSNSFNQAQAIDHLDVAPSRRYHVFQFSGTGVASTMTVNLLTGLFEGKEQGMAYWECKHGELLNRCAFWQRLNGIYGRKSAYLINSTIVTKTHVENVDTLQSWFGSDFDNIFFIGNERKDSKKMLPKEYCAKETYPNVLCLEYSDLQYDDEKSLRKVVRYVKDKIREYFPYFANVQLKEDEAVQRLLDMAESYKGTPGYKTTRYGVGGGNAKNHTLSKNV